jgi:restriction endonuclease Mrr
MSHPDMREKKQVTARITPEFARDLNLVMACTKTDNATQVVQDAVHQLAEYYRYAIQRRLEAVASARQDDTQGV